MSIYHVVHFVHGLTSLTTSDVPDSGGEAAFGKGAGAGSQAEEPAAFSTADSQTSLHHQHQGNSSTRLH